MADEVHPHVAELIEAGRTISRPGGVFEALLELLHPEIPWRRPIPIMAGEREGVACRICIAASGFDAPTGRLYRGIDDFTKHMIEQHS